MSFNHISPTNPTRILCRYNSFVTFNLFSVANLFCRQTKPSPPALPKTNLAPHKHTHFSLAQQIFPITKNTRKINNEEQNAAINHRHSYNKPWQGCKYDTKTNNKVKSTQAHKQFVGYILFYIYITARSRS